MALGLAHGEVTLVPHDPQWEREAADTIRRLHLLLNGAAKDIQHVGSTSIRGIKAKPVIDIAVAAEDFSRVLALTPALEAEGFLFVGWEGADPQQPVFQCGDPQPDAKAMRVLTITSISSRRTVRNGAIISAFATT